MGHSLATKHQCLVKFLPFFVLFSSSQKCKLEQHENSLFGCSIVFENKVSIGHMQTWQTGLLTQEARDFKTPDTELRLALSKLKGHGDVRVRVKTENSGYNSHWSHWSPTSSWKVNSSDNLGNNTNMRICLHACVYIYTLLLEGKAVPNPSKYFQSLHSVHEGNLKKWLNPLSVSESFFTAQPIDQISPVEVCEDFDVVPSTSPSSSSTSALLHFQNSDTSGIVNNSASSSIFSNRSYFTSSSSGGFACIDPTPAYFTYHGDFQPSLCPSLCGFPTYESLKREPQSPDSGFGIELEANNEEERYMEGGEQFLLDDRNIPFLILPVRFPPHTCPAFSPPTPPTWLVPGAMCRSSSMPVEPGKTGYLTLKELQATFSNKSI
uniref:Interleukin-2 receptor subunit beta N-terminal domain-containing protein n=1 Tax=Neolamprologus brichardi TaxID=32507 RepID=A0A3Q4GIG1_NEOBR